MKTSRRLENAPPACGRDRVGSQHRCEILPPKPNQERNIIKWKRIRRGGFFPLRSAKRNISHHEVIYRIRRIYRAEGISCALRARGEGAKTSDERRFSLLPSGRQGRRPLEAQGIFRAALAVFRRKMEAGADKTESTFAVGKYVCGRRLKKLFEKSFGLLAGTELFKSFSATVVFSFCEM